MKRIVLDTNVLVSFLTDRNLQQQARAATLLKAASEGSLEIIVHQAVVIEMVYVLGKLYGMDRHEIAGTVADLLAAAGVTATNDVAWPRVLDLWPNSVVDFADAILVVATMVNRYDAVATFDQRLSRQLERQGLAPYWPGL